MSAVIPKYTDRLVNNSDFWVEIQRGSFADMMMIHKFGKNSIVGDGTWEIISDIGGAYVWPQAPTTVRVKAGGNAADASAGAGARTIRVEGIDENLAEVTEDITLNADGTLASASTTTTFWRLNRARVVTVGSYTAPVNTGIITIEDTAGTMDLLLIEAATSSTFHCAYSIPTGMTAHLIGFTVHVDANKDADIRLCTRSNFTDVTVPVSPSIVHRIDRGVLGDHGNQPKSPLFALAGPADFWLEAKGSGQITEVSGDMEILCIMDEDTTVKADS
jgi:hypothetical protein